LTPGADGEGGVVTAVDDLDGQSADAGSGHGLVALERELL
jgi:hypothetical protein